MQNSKSKPQLAGQECHVKFAVFSDFWAQLLKYRWAGNWSVRLCTQSPYHKKAPQESSLGGLL